jgi:hypothetical protein
VVTDKWIDEKGKPGTNTTNKIRQGDFEIIFDETPTLSANVKIKKDKKITALINKKI